MAQPFLDHLLVSNPFFDITPPLTFTAEFSLSSLASVIVVSLHTTFIRAVLTIQDAHWQSRVCCCSCILRENHSSERENLNLVLSFLWPFSLGFPYHVPFMAIESCSTKNRFLACHSNIYSESLTLPHHM